MEKILYIITQSEFGGAQRYVFDLATNLSGEFDIIVAAGENPNNGLFQKLQKANIKNTYLKHLKRKINPWHDLLAFFEIKRLIKKEKPDIIHLNSSKAGILGSLASKFAHSYNSKADFHDSHRIIYTVHGWVFNESISRLRKKIYLWLEKFTAKYKNKIICVSEYDKQIALEQDFPNEKLITIHNGANAGQLEFLSKENARKILISKIPLSPIFEKKGLEEIFIGTIANLYPVKGIEYLIEAARLLSAKNKMHDIKFFVIGEGAERKKLESKIKNYGLKDVFFLIGHVPNAYKYLKAFDMFVMPSIKEGFPYAILEAMEAGVPVAATSVGGVPEIINDGKNGLLAEPKNSQDLAEKITYLLKNKDICNSILANAQAALKEQFSLEKMLRKTKKAYQKN